MNGSSATGEEGDGDDASTAKGDDDTPTGEGAEGIDAGTSPTDDASAAFSTEKKTFTETGGTDVSFFSIFV